MPVSVVLAIAYAADYVVSGSNSVPVSTILVILVVLTLPISVILILMAVSLLIAPLLVVVYPFLWFLWSWLY